jgi:photosystem II stability/assembly factor-like uncharacterized protein
MPTCRPQFLILPIFIHFFLAVCGVGQARTNNPAAHAVVDFGFCDQEHGWAVVWTKSGTTLFRSETSGKTWHQEKGVTGVRRAFFLNFTTGWAVTSEASGWYLYGTTDGGRNWAPLSKLILPDPWSEDVVLDLRFLDDRTGWLLMQTGHGEGSLILKIVDAGKRIQLEQGITEPRFMSSFAAPNGSLWLVGIDNRIAKREAASEWQFQKAAHYGPGANWFRGLMLNDRVGFIAGQGRVGTILKTEDGGGTWHSVLEVKSMNSFFDISFFDSRSGCAVGTSQSLYCTVDAGEHWSEMPTLPSASDPGQAAEFVRVLFLNRNHAYLIRDGGFIYESTDGGKTWKDDKLFFQR